jgi:uncharacterized glyoxalase superfamily protein PhnB
MRTPDGKIMHAEAQIGDSKVMLGQAHGENQPMPCMLYLYVRAVDTSYKRAVRWLKKNSKTAGGSVQEPKDEFYGDRVGAVRDPNGNLWYLATHVEDVSEEELGRRAQEAMKRWLPIIGLSAAISA